METHISGLYDTVPLTVGELKIHFREIEYEKLSDSGKYVYNQVQDFLTKEDNLLKKFNINTDPFKLSANLRINTELMFKSNPDINWTYNYYFKDNPLTLPLMFGFSNYFTIHVDPFIGKNYESALKSTNWTNIPTDFNEVEFSFPEFAVTSTGLYFDKWGVDLKVGRKGLTVGRTATGSIIYNNTFDTDCYFTLNLFTNVAKYNMHVIQVQSGKYLYLHQISARLFKFFELQFLEGSLINAPFELRYLNPLMIMHSYASWLDYGFHDDNEIIKNWYDESNFCAYFSILLNVNIIKNTRLYFMFAQNEYQQPNEHPYNPDSLGLQGGAEVLIPAFDNGYFTANTEIVYTSPFFYIKQAPQWSLYRTKMDNQTKTWTPINSWIGTPFGPDCFAVQASFGYKKTNKWEANIGYIMSIHGENSFNIFDETPDSNGIYHYYPYTHYYESIVLQNQGRLDEAEQKRQEAYNYARNMWMSGIPEYKNQLYLSGTYKIFNNLAINGKFVYTFVFNNKHYLDRFEKGVELSLGVTYSIF